MRVAGPMSDDEQLQVALDSTTSQFDLRNDQDLAPLDLDYRDPFLGAIESQSNVPASAFIDPKVPVTTTTSHASNTVKTTEVWPEVGFIGMVRNTNTEDGLALLVLNGKTHSLAAGDEIAEIRLVQYWRDSALIAWGSEQKILTK